MDSLTQLKKISHAVLISLALVGSSCSNDIPDDPEDLDLVVTSPGTTNFRFDLAQTYALPTSIPLIKQNDAEAEPVQTTLNSQLQTTILDTIAQNMNQLGFRRITTPSEGKPDVVVEVSAFGTTSTATYYSAWPATWGGFYSPWYGAAYGVGWAPVTVPYVTTLNYGTLLINMTNPNAPDPTTQTIPTVWTAGLNGILDQSVNPDTGSQRIVDAINQAFAQSPYLKSGTSP